MSIFDGNMPYTNLHELNLDWVLKKVKDSNEEIEKLKKMYSDMLSDTILQFLNEHIEEITLQATYIETTKTLRIGVDTE